MRIFLLTNRGFEGDWFLRDLEHLAHLGHGDVHALGDFFRRGLSSQLLHQLPRSPNQLVDGFNHVDRDANRARLISNCTSNRLPNPPRGVGGELIAAPVFELVHGLHQADVAFLNQVEKLQAAVGVFFRNRNYETKVGLDQLTLGLLRIHVPLDDFALVRLSSWNDTPASTSSFSSSLRIARDCRRYSLRCSSLRVASAFFSRFCDWRSSERIVSTVLLARSMSRLRSVLVKP